MSGSVPIHFGGQSFDDSSQKISTIYSAAPKVVTGLGSRIGCVRNICYQQVTRSLDRIEKVTQVVNWIFCRGVQLGRNTRQKFTPSRGNTPRRFAQFAMS